MCVCVCVCDVVWCVNMSHEFNERKFSNLLQLSLFVLFLDPAHQPPVKSSPLKTHQQRLPALNNMQPIAFIAVDTERENLKLHKFPSSRVKNDVLSVGGTKMSGGGVASPKSARATEKARQSPSMQRSFSLK